MPQQVPLLGEGSATLITLEWPFTYRHMDEQRILEINYEKYNLHLLTFRVITDFVHKITLLLCHKQRQSGLFSPV